MNLNEHLKKLEELADAFAGNSGDAIALGRSMGTPKDKAIEAHRAMRSTFLLGAMAATGLLWPEPNADIPAEWLERNGVPNPDDHE